jgi:hypothetical protein
MSSIVATVIPAKARIPLCVITRGKDSWIPAFAGTTARMRRDEA